MVPMDQPKASLQMLQSWTKGKVAIAGSSSVTSPLWWSRCLTEWHLFPMSSQHKEKLHRDEWVSPSQNLRQDWGFPEAKGFGNNIQNLDSVNLVLCVSWALYGTSTREESCRTLVYTNNDYNQLLILQIYKRYKPEQIKGITKIERSEKRRLWKTIPISSAHTCLIQVWGMCMIEMVDWSFFHLHWKEYECKTPTEWNANYNPTTMKNWNKKLKCPFCFLCTKATSQYYFLILWPLVICKKGGAGEWIIYGTCSLHQWPTSTWCNELGIDLSSNLMQWYIHNCICSCNTFLELESCIQPIAI